jgi:hypothetical protein
MGACRTAWELPISPTFLPMAPSRPDPMCELSVRFGRLPWTSIFGNRPPRRGSRRPRDIPFYPLTALSHAPRCGPRSSRLRGTRPHNALHGRASAQACDCGFDVFSGSRIVGAGLAIGRTAGITVTGILRLPRRPLADPRICRVPRGRDAGIREGVGQRTKRMRHKRAPSVRRRALEFIAPHPGCTGGLSSRLRTFRPRFFFERLALVVDRGRRGAPLPGSGRAAARALGDAEGQSGGEGRIAARAYVRAGDAQVVVSAQRRLRVDAYAINVAT